jgi:hypothetical protein
VTPERLFDNVIAAAPDFQAVKDEHLRDNDELLLHVLMADLLRYLGSHFIHPLAVAARPPTASELKAVLQILDAAMVNGDPDVENAIAVSFIEGIESEPFFSGLSSLLGPHLRAELERQKAWRPSAR